MRLDSRAAGLCCKMTRSDQRIAEPRKRKSLALWYLGALVAIFAIWLAATKSPQSGNAFSLTVGRSQVIASMVESVRSALGFSPKPVADKCSCAVCCPFDSSILRSVSREGPYSPSPSSSVSVPDANSLFTWIGWIAR